MKRHFILGLMLIVTGFTSTAQVINIPFFETQPVIDGIPDKESTLSQWQSFSRIEKSHEKNGDYTVLYKIGYNHSYLYLMIELGSDSIVVRDRAYQNGDGFHMVIARPDSGNPADEFYVLRFSPYNKAKSQSARKGLWYYNVDLSGKGLSAATQFECQSINGKSYFELLLPWSDVYPYNPLFSATIGINLCFVKAIGEKEKNYYFMKYDERIQSEQSKREYVVANFEPPENVSNPSSFVRLEKKNNEVGKSLKVKVISFSPSATKGEYYFTVRSADNYLYSELRKEVALSEGMNINQFDLPVEKLNMGGYKVTWKCSDNSEGETPLTILPEIDEEKEIAAVEVLKDIISVGDYNTLLFMLQNIIKAKSDLKDYETAGNIRESYLTYQNYKIELKTNPRLLSERTGISRRAFSSNIDTTLQPYSVKIPKDFDPKKKYPLFVMLHGSGSSDQGMLNSHLTEDNFIEIAPNGRGTSNCFAADNANIDVKEAIEDVIKNYPIDTSNIIIAGFSMGGYGAYRIFYEFPELFKGIVVFSGHPNLANKWLGEGHPNFLDPKYLKLFKNIPVFIYHSKNDLNCPFDFTEELVNKLRKAGAKVEFVTTNEGGHGIIDNNSLPEYFKWLKNTIEK